MGVIARQSIKASIATYVGIVIGAINTLYITPKFLTTSEIGLINTILKMGMLLAPFLSLGAPLVMLRFYPRYKTEKDDGGLILTCLYQILFSGIFFGFLYWLVRYNISGFFEENSPNINNYLFYPLILGVLIVFTQLFQNISIANYRITIPSLFTNTINKSLNLLNILLYGIFGFSTLLFIKLYFAGFYIIPLVLLVFYIAVVIKPTVKKINFRDFFNILKKTSSYSLFLAFSTISGVIVFSIDSIMLTGLKGESHTGIYTIAFFIASIIEIPRRMLGQLSIPLLSKAFNDNDIPKIKKFYKDSSSNLMFFGFLAFICIWVNISYLFNIMPNGEIFATGISVVLYIGLSKLFDMIMGSNSQIIEASSFFKYNFLTNSVLAILTIAFNLWLIPVHGITGAALASLLAVSIKNILSFIIVYLKFGMTPFSKKHILFILFGVTLFLLSSVLKLNSSNNYLNIIVNTITYTFVVLLVGLLLSMSKTANNLFKKIIKR